MILLSTTSWVPPALDAAMSSALLARADRSGRGGSLRLFVPERAVVFGRQDRARPGFARAVASAERRGFAPVMRLAGGRAAVFHEGTVAIALAVAEPRPRETITERFEATAAAVAAAVRSLGVDAAVGEIPGEYCPGAYSVHSGNGTKIVGLGQRLARRAAHVGGVVVVDGADLVNEVLVPVYRHLGYDWDPAVTGDIATHAAVTPAAVIDALAEAMGGIGHRLTPGEVDAEEIAYAGTIAADHDAAIA